jgi:uncharacterized protein (TIGR03034 family)
MNMNNEQSLVMQLPYVVFHTIHQFDDKSADDMQYGDMDEHELKSLGVSDISSRVDPYRLIKYDNNYQGAYISDAGYFPPNISGTSITKEECVDILFKEMKDLAKSFYNSSYAKLVISMIDHFRYGHGQNFCSTELDMAYSDFIVAERYNNSLDGIKVALNRKYGKQAAFESYSSLFFDMKIEINNRRLPKFTRREDRTNGLGISIHDIYAQEIRLLSFRKHQLGWDSTVYFKAQDHFGLDKNDILDPVFKQFRFFRIWFFLQRHCQYAFKPFFTNFSSIQNLQEFQ